MKAIGPILMLLILVSIVADVTAADWKAIEGTYAFTARNYLDPADEDPKHSHLRFQLTGETAKDLYLALKVAEKPDECTGATAKQVGEMRCLFHKEEESYACHFSIDVMRQMIEHGVAC